MAGRAVLVGQVGSVVGSISSISALVIDGFVQVVLVVANINDAQCTISISGNIFNL